jgi:hypothetical protein
MLRNRHNSRLMRLARHNRAHPIRARLHAARHVHRYIALRVLRRVHALEEDEVFRVRELGGGEAVDGLDDDVRVPDDLALGVELLRVREVGLLRVGEGAELYARGGERDGEGGVGGDGVEVLRALYAREKRNTE